MRQVLLGALALLAACGGEQRRSTPAAPPTTRPERAPASRSDASEPAPAGSGEAPAEPEPAAEGTGGGEAAVSEAFRLYDTGDAAGALEHAERLLAAEPDNLRLLRLATSAACALGDRDRARRHFDRLPAHDKEQISRRCQRYGIELGATGAAPR